MDTMTGSLSWFSTGSVRACGSSTSTPCMSIGAVTMKITSSTSITSM